MTVILILFKREVPRPAHTAVFSGNSVGKPLYLLSQWWGALLCFLQSWRTFLILTSTVILHSIKTSTQNLRERRILNSFVCSCPEILEFCSWDLRPWHPALLLSVAGDNYILSLPVSAFAFLPFNNHPYYRVWPGSPILVRVPPQSSSLQTLSQIPLVRKVKHILQQVYIELKMTLLYFCTNMRQKL
jgi:hypothetical protein